VLIMRRSRVRASRGTISFPFLSFFPSLVWNWFRCYLMNIPQ
jgi:hypothetical protein